MNNKKIIALLISGLMLMPTVAYAKGNPHDSSNKGGQIVSEEKVQSNKQVKSSSSDENEKVEKKKNEEKKIEKKKQIEAFKTEMKAKHETMKQIRQQTTELKKQVQTKTAQLKTITNNIQAGKKTLPQDMLTALLSTSDNLKIDTTELKATSDINKHLSEAQEKVNKKDFNNALSSLDKVISRLQARLDALKKLNTDLDAALAIANLATVPAPVTPAVLADNQTATKGMISDTTTSNSATTTN